MRPDHTEKTHDFIGRVSGRANAQLVFSVIPNARSRVVCVNRSEESLRASVWSALTSWK